MTPGPGMANGGASAPPGILLFALVLCITVPGVGPGTVMVDCDKTTIAGPSKGQRWQSNKSRPASMRLDVGAVKRLVAENQMPHLLFYKPPGTGPRVHIYAIATAFESIKCIF